ncbi:polysaccharide pyruvyl transferase family protein [bacterium]|nr:polysaccharide pyruvyl transferase family protein [bacterium]
MKKIYTILLGYFGNGNIGDELILDGTLKEKRYKNPVIISSNPWFHRDKYNIRSIYKYNFMSIIWIFFKTKELVIPGGGIFQDISSSRSLYYYLFFIILAKMFGIKVIVRNVGVGPFVNFYNRSLTRSVLKMAAYLSVRDRVSLDILNIKKAKLNCDTIYEVEKYYEKGSHIGSDKLTIGLNLRKWQNIKRIIKELGFALSEYKTNEKINFLLIPFLPNDEKYLEKLYQHIGENAFMVCANPENIFTVINQCDICIGMRLHFTAIAGLLNKPVLNITYDSKCKNAIKENPNVHFVSVKGIKATSISRKIRTILDGIR